MLLKEVREAYITIFLRREQRQKSQMHFEIKLSLFKFQGNLSEMVI